MLHTDLTAGTPAGPLYGEQLGSALAIYLTRRLAVQKLPPRGSTRCKLPGPLLSRVCELIEARLNTPIGLKDLAREARLSRFYFAKLFRNSTGHSPYQYVMQRRIERAKDMLAQEN